VFEAWERGSDIVDAALAGVGAYEVEDPFASHEVEDSAAEEGEDGFVVPFFADQEVGGVVSFFTFAFALMAFASVC
jgi:hypothetical protein